MKKEIILKISNDIHLAIEGNYYKAEEENGLPEVFEIEKIESLVKDIYPILEWFQAQKTPFSRLEELSLEEYNNQL